MVEKNLSRNVFLTILLTAIMLVLIRLSISPSRKGFAQETPSARQSADALAQSKRVRLAPWWTILLPENYKAYRTDNLVDAWYGYIESTDHSFRVRYTAGLVQSPFEVDKDRIVWTKALEVDRFRFHYGLKRTAEGNRLIASLNGLYFSTEYRDETDLQRLLDLMRSCSSGQCSECPLVPTIVEADPAKKRKKSTKNPVRKA